MCKLGFNWVYVGVRVRARVRLLVVMVNVRVRGQHMSVYVFTKKAVCVQIFVVSRGCILMVMP